ncbi:MAG TPA: tetratricopeptide repeat protein [Bacteroidales bacterium]|nr:tetratricopeptide repeat protein [Bacteroidales bacterium]
MQLPLYSQADKKYIRKGNREYSKNNYSDSEILYRKAGDENNHSYDASFNIGDALYKQEKYEDAVKQFADNTGKTDDLQKKSDAWYNLGNSLLNSKKLEESINAYKNALKLNPENLEAKYNLGYAQDLLKKQQQQQQQDKQNKDQQKQQDKKDQQQGQQPENKEDTQQQQQQQQPQDGTLSKEDAERLLNALANDEREVQEKVKREKASKARTRVLKNW